MTSNFDARSLLAFRLSGNCILWKFNKKSEGEQAQESLSVDNTSYRNKYSRTFVLESLQNYPAATSFIFKALFSTGIGYNTSGTFPFITSNALAFSFKELRTIWITFLFTDAIYIYNYAE